MSSAVVGAAAREQDHQDRQHTGGDGGGQRQPRLLGPVRRHGRGPVTGLGALATVDFACAAASFAAEASWPSPLVSASCRRRPARASATPSGGVFADRLFCAAFLAGAAFLAALAGAFFAALLLLGRPWPAPSWPGGLRRRAGRICARRRTSRGSAAGLRRQAFRRVDPAGLPSGCSFAVSRPARSAWWYPAVAPIMPGRVSR